MTDPVMDPGMGSIQGHARIFCDIGRILTSSLNPREVFNSVMKLIGEFFSPRNWSLLLMEEETGRLKFEIVMGVDANRLKQIHIEKNEGIAGWVCQNRQPAIVADVKKDPRFSPRVDGLLGFSTSSIVCVPILNGSNRIIGALEMVNEIEPPPENAGPESRPVYSDKVDQPFTVLDMEILSAIGAFTGIAAENAFLHQKIKDLAMVDPLTGVYNRHYFNEVLKREQERTKRDYYSICILMMDIDNLKAINDRFGHLAGDKVICDIANIMKTSIRESDVLARYGGDEFIILMPNAREDEGKSLAERIHRLIRQKNEGIRESNPGLGLSIGIYASGSDDLSMIIQQADRELYLTKYFRKRPDEITSVEELRSYMKKNFSLESE